MIVTNRQKQVLLLFGVIVIILFVVNQFFPSSLLSTIIIFSTILFLGTLFSIIRPFKKTLKTKFGLDKKIRPLDLVVIIVSVISLIISITLTSHSLYLTEQANTIAEKSLELQNIQVNSTAIIKAHQMQAVLLDEGYFNPDDSYSTSKVRSVGWLNDSIIILTAQPGFVEIDKISFSLDDSFSYLSTEKVGSTDVDILPAYAPWSVEKPVFVGFNTITFAYRIYADYYPDPEKIPAYISNLVNSSTIFPIGNLNLVANFETQVGYQYEKEFSISIYAVIRSFHK